VQIGRICDRVFADKLRRTWAQIATGGYADFYLISINSFGSQSASEELCCHYAAIRVGFLGMYRLLLPAALTVCAANSLLAQPSASVATATPTAGTGIIQGTTTDSASHRAVGSAIVTVVRAGLPPVSQTVTAGADGAFAFQGLPAGTYTVCAQAPASGYLNPCEFATVPLKVTLTAGQKSANNTVGMVAGAILHVRVQDPQQLAVPAASVKAGSPPSPDISVGVWSMGFPGSRFFPARITGTDSTGLDYQVTIPQDTSLALHVSSRHLKLADAAGAVLTGNTSQTKVQHKSGDANPVSLTFSVTGVIP